MGRPDHRSGPPGPGERIEELLALLAPERQTKPPPRARPAARAPRRLRRRAGGRFRSGERRVVDVLCRRTLLRGVLQHRGAGCGRGSLPHEPSSRCDQARGRDGDRRSVAAPGSGAWRRSSTARLGGAAERQALWAAGRRPWGRALVGLLAGTLAAVPPARRAAPSRKVTSRPQRPSRS